MNEIILRNMSEESKRNMTPLKHTTIELTSGIVAGIAAATLSQVHLYTLAVTGHLSDFSPPTLCYPKSTKAKAAKAELYPVYILWAKQPDFVDYSLDWDLEW